ncbi:MAG TPA: tetratricopeptide repeat protein [Candidatus Acidoferrum sp.]|nr:tetratricopeptide repeat protein [Candidatus Acidoferrum sp.]
MNLGFPTESAKSTAELDHVAEFRQGLELLKNEYPQKALVRLRRAFECEKHNPYYLSFLGLSIARAQRKWDQATELCEIAVQLRPKEIQFHLNLGEVYASSGRREKALDMLEAALKLFGEDARLKQARSKVENRRNPLVPIFGREHFLNRELGKLRHRTLKRLGKDSN